MNPITNIVSNEGLDNKLLINAKTAYLLNADNNQTLYTKFGEKTMYPASTTKIMTALIALKYGNLNSIINVNAAAVGLRGSNMGLKKGDQLTLRDLLRGMLTVSGNDAAQAIAEHIGNGSSETFIKLMNDEAIALGVEQTHFSNPHGLEDPNNYTTARDLAIITAYAYRQPSFVDYVNHKFWEIRYINRGITEKMENTNRMLEVYPGCNGVKTGTSTDAGECLVAAAKQDGVQLIAVVLNSISRWKDATKLLDYGFKS
jgi:D-alanyl-D-alanine carboxypeptidase (penicillin-binding protein 5/6)